MEMMKQSLRAWSVLDEEQVESGDKFLATTGLACIDDKHAGEHFEVLESTLKRHGLKHARFSAAQARKRFPSFRRLPDDMEILYLEQAGILAASRAVLATWKALEALPTVDTMEYTEAVRLVPRSEFDNVSIGLELVQKNPNSEIKLKKFLVEARQSVILTPGAWLSKISRKFASRSELF